MATDDVPVALDGDLGQRLERTFRACLRDDDDAPPADLDAARRGETAGWDSVGHLHLVAALEEEFGVELDIDDIVDLETFADARTILNRLGVDR